jgi:hypothetical protein
MNQKRLSGIREEEKIGSYRETIALNFFIGLLVVRRGREPCFL